MGDPNPRPELLRLRATLPTQWQLSSRGSNMHALIEFALRRRRLPLAAGLLVLVTMFVLALPVASSGQAPLASTTVCQVTGSASAPTYLEV